MILWIAGDIVAAAEFGVTESVGCKIIGAQPKRRMQCNSKWVTPFNSSPVDQ